MNRVLLPLLLPLLAVPVVASAFFLLFGGTRAVRGVAVFWLLVVVVGVLTVKGVRRARSR
jgi:uncharacterized integral membrane protein